MKREGTFRFFFKKKLGVEAKNSLIEEFNDLRKIEMKIEIVHLLEK
jgi:hypothetical protein